MLIMKILIFVRVSKSRYYRSSKRSTIYMIRVTIRLPVVSVLAIIIVYGKEQFIDNVLGAAAFICKEL